MQKVLWTVSLSNGETVYEEKGNFKTITGELSPWQRLKTYMAERDVVITSLSLYMDNGKRWNLPSGGSNPKFKAFADCPKPVSFNFFRKVGMDFSAGGTETSRDLYHVVEAQYENGSKIQVWVDEETGNSWSLVA